MRLVEKLLALGRGLGLIAGCLSVRLSVCLATLPDNFSATLHVSAASANSRKVTAGKFCQFVLSSTFAN